MGISRNLIAAVFDAMIRYLGNCGCVIYLFNAVGDAFDGLSTHCAFGYSSSPDSDFKKSFYLTVLDRVFGCEFLSSW